MQCAVTHSIWHRRTRGTPALVRCSCPSLVSPYYTRARGRMTASEVNSPPRMCEAYTMDLRIFTEPQQGASYDTLLSVAKATEDLGFDPFSRSDHYLKTGDGDGLPGSTDAWITLAGLARETKRIRLGTLMTAGTFRLPGVLAIQVAQVDQMSGGRVELGLGAGWYEEEHTAY